MTADFLARLLCLLVIAAFIGFAGWVATCDDDWT
jgi:hypothetical protein